MDVGGVEARLCCWPNMLPQNSSPRIKFILSFVLFCFVLFCFVLFCFVLFCFVLFCFVLFYFTSSSLCFMLFLLFCC